MIQFQEEQKGLFTFYKQQAEQEQKFIQSIPLKKKHSYTPFLKTNNNTFEMIHNKNLTQKDKQKRQNYQYSNNLAFQSNEKNIRDNLKPKTNLKNKRSYQFNNIKIEQLSKQIPVIVKKSKISSKQNQTVKRNRNKSQEIVKNYQLIFDKKNKSSKPKLINSNLVPQICSQRVLRIKQLTNCKITKQQLPKINSKIKTQHNSNFSIQILLKKVQNQRFQHKLTSFKQIKKKKQLLSEHKNKNKEKTIKKNNYQQKNVEEIIRLMKKQKRGK